MNLKELSDQVILDETHRLVREERRLTLEILHHLREIERRRLYAGRGYPSLFEYAVRELGYSESAAQRRIASMRLLREIPDIEKTIERGGLTLSVVAQAQTFFKQEAKAEKPLTLEQKKEILLSLEGKSTREAEKTLLSRSSQPVELARPDRVRPVTESHSEIRFLADAALLEDIETLRNLLAHSRPGMTLSEALQYALGFTLDRLDPVRRAREAKTVGLLPAPAVGKSDLPAKSEKVIEKSRYIPASLRRAIFLRDQGKCTYVDPRTGRRCLSRYAVEIDHRQPWAVGGATTIKNLRLLCRTHNQWHAIKSFGRDKIERAMTRRDLERSAEG